MVVHGTGLRDQVSQAWRLGRGIRVERRLLHVAAPGPESGADYLVRIGLLSHSVRPGSRRGPAPREARHREVAAAPEEVRRAAFAARGSAKPLDSVVRLAEASA